ncbi:hypothetical protein EXN66_Car018137 [Channa argus]|uniref:Uncharacterized protein n=1 Tax=Channa argus TaxID=215402 RepID=A0A6G1QJ85_CHAAH|nr:hypothetical protein EXN66_Car018137 [Channa argus]
MMSGGPSTTQKTPGKTLQHNDPTMVEQATKLCTLSKLTPNIPKTAENRTLPYLPMHLNLLIKFFVVLIWCFSARTVQSWHFSMFTRLIDCALK